MIDKDLAHRLERDAAEFGALAKDVRALSDHVSGCRQELQKAVAGNPTLAKGVARTDASLMKMDGVLVEIARRLDRLASAPLPLPFRTDRKELAS